MGRLPAGRSASSSRAAQIDRGDNLAAQVDQSLDGPGGPAARGSYPGSGSPPGPEDFDAEEQAVREKRCKIGWCGHTRFFRVMFFLRSETAGPCASWHDSTATVDNRSVANDGLQIEQSVTLSWITSRSQQASAGVRAVNVQGLLHDVDDPVDDQPDARRSRNRRRLAGIGSRRPGQRFHGQAHWPDESAAGSRRGIGRLPGGPPARFAAVQFFQSRHLGKGKAMRRVSPRPRRAGSAGCSVRSWPRS